jgi:head-tail adaptor
MGGILTNADLAMIQAEAEANILPDSCSILRATFTTTSQGGQSQSWSTLASGVACLVDSGRGGSEFQTGADRVMPGGGFEIAVPYDQDITEKDRIQVTTLSNRTFEVTGVAKDSWLMLTSCACEEFA